MAPTTQQAPCPQCGEPVALTLATSETSDQIAAERTACPNCDVPLARAIAGHADGGGRLDDARAGGGAEEPPRAGRPPVMGRGRSRPRAGTRAANSTGSSAPRTANRYPAA